MKQFSLRLLGIIMICLPSLGAWAGLSEEAKPQINTYKKIVYKNYQDALSTAEALQASIDAFLISPSQETLDGAKQKWLEARTTYSQTEAFRFYEGPIDFANQKTGEEGPEGRLNAWPLNEAYIDYVKGNPKSGIINDPSIEITKTLLKEKNQALDEADVATGYHAIEFLLWGQDFSTTGPGARPVSDYVGDSVSTKRRRQYLKVVTDILVDDLKFLVTEWRPYANNYAKSFGLQPADEAIANMFTSLATLSAFEMAAERMGTALDSGDQEDEHSCFSDNTHNDFIDNAKGISNVYFGEYGDFKGDSLHTLLTAKAPQLAEQIKSQLRITETLLDELGAPIDNILSEPKGHPQRQKMELAVMSLQIQGDLFKQAGEALDLDVQIIR